MIGIVEAVGIILPLLVLVILSIILSSISLGFRTKTGEESLFHLTIIFLFSAVLFLSIAGGVFIEGTTNQNSLFALANFAFWFLLMEVGIFYLTMFQNPNQILPSARLYVPAILGAAVCISSLKFLESTFSLSQWELIIYIVAILTALLLQTILVNELRHAKKLLKNENHIVFISAVERIMLVGTICLVYGFSSVISWFFIRSQNLTEAFSIEFSEFLPIDWAVYFNIPILLVSWILFYWDIRRINQIMTTLDLQEIYNTIA